MQAWLQPMQASTSRPAAVFATNSGSAISARVMPTASASPSATSRSASATSTTRVVPITGTSTAARATASGSAIPAGGRVGVGAPVRPQREELRDQVTVRHRDLDAVEAPLAAVARGRRVSVHALGPLARGRRARLTLEARRRDRRGREGGRGGGGRGLLPPPLEELDEKLPAALVHGVGEL